MPARNRPPAGKPAGKPAPPARRPPPPPAPVVYHCRATIAAGLEAALKDELDDLGLKCTAEEGAVVFDASDAQLRLVHLWSRLAGRISVVLGRFNAGTLEQLGTGARRMPWARFVHPHQPLDLHFAARGSHLRLKDAVLKKVEHAVTDALRGPRIGGGRPPRTPVGILIRAEDEKVEISVDATGEPLHKRGWRQETAKAPLRENLAAAVLRLADWAPGEALVDPMCGSGTFSIEAAGIALRQPPGARRTFAFETWPGHDARAWAAEKAERSPALDLVAPIRGSDRDPGAIRASRANAARADVERRVAFDERSFADVVPPAETGLIVMNPPYGERIERGSGLAGMRAVGDVLAARWKGWRFAILLSDARLKSALKVPTEELASFSNGGIPVRLYAGIVPL